MSLFGSSSKNTYAEKSPEVAETKAAMPETVEAKVPSSTYISSTMVVRGDISAENIKVDGFVKGNITADGVVVTNGVDGNITAKEVKLEKAKVHGNISGGKVTVLKESVVAGDISADSLYSEGSVKGNLDIVNDAKLPAGAIVVGDVIADDILTEKGAVIVGMLSIRNQAKPDLESVFNFGGLFDEQ